MYFYLMSNKDIYYYYYLNSLIISLKFTFTPVSDFPTLLKTKFRFKISFKLKFHSDSGVDSGAPRLKLLLLYVEKYK